MATFEDDPDHPILDAPFRWELLEFTFRRDPTDRRESYIDMVFGREGMVRRLRFFGPQQLSIPEGFEGVPNTSGMAILDVSRRQLEGLRVRVANSEQLGGAPSFWAARVIEIEEPTRA